jgi:hypothetical protein
MGHVALSAGLRSVALSASNGGRGTCPAHGSHGQTRRTWRGLTLRCSQVSGYPRKGNLEDGLGGNPRGSQLGRGTRNIQAQRQEADRQSPREGSAAGKPGLGYTEDSSQ